MILFIYINIIILDNGTSTSEIMMYNWVNSFPLSTSESITTICEGITITSSIAVAVKNILEQKSEEEKDVEVNNDNTTYCSTNVIPKTFTQV